MSMYDSLSSKAGVSMDSLIRKLAHIETKRQKKERLKSERKPKYHIGIPLVSNEALDSNLTTGCPYSGEHMMMPPDPLQFQEPHDMEDNGRDKRYDEQQGVVDDLHNAFQTDADPNLSMSSTIQSGNIVEMDDKSTETDSTKTQSITDVLEFTNQKGFDWYPADLNELRIQSMPSMFRGDIEKTKAGDQSPGRPSSIHSSEIPPTGYISAPEEITPSRTRRATYRHFEARNLPTRYPFSHPRMMENNAESENIKAGPLEDERLFDQKIYDNAHNHIQPGDDLAPKSPQKSEGVNDVNVRINLRLSLDPETQTALSQHYTRNKPEQDYTLRPSLRKSQRASGPMNRKRRNKIRYAELDSLRHKSTGIPNPAIDTPWPEMGVGTYVTLIGVISVTVGFTAGFGFRHFTSSP